MNACIIPYEAEGYVFFFGAKIYCDKPLLVARRLQDDFFAYEANAQKRQMLDAFFNKKMAYEDDSAFWKEVFKCFDQEPQDGLITEIENWLDAEWAAINEAQEGETPPDQDVPSPRKEHIKYNRLFLLLLYAFIISLMLSNL